MSVWPAEWHPRAVVFDLDGLMFNTEELYQDVGGELLRRRGKTFTGDLLDQMMGRPARVSLQIMIDWHQLDATPDELARETEEIFAGILAERLECMPGLVELLASLERAGIPKAIATSSGPRFAADVLAKFGFAPRFQFVLTSADIVEGKPNPEIYLDGLRGGSTWHRAICSCWKTATTVARRRFGPARSQWPCRPATAAGTTSPERLCRSTRWPTRGCIACCGSNASPPLERQRRTDPRRQAA